MSSYLSNLLTQTTSKYNTLRRTLLSSEDDGDTEDDTHICRVLRAYYTEKGRRFPQWLPPDPNDKRGITPQPYAPQSGYAGKGQFADTQSQGGQRSGLSDLWDAPAAPQTAPSQPQSLRNARRPMNQPSATAHASLAPPQVRPLPSQRAGSYQSVSSQQSGSRPGSRVEPSPPGSSHGPTVGGSAQERLKARLWGGKGGTSPTSFTGSYDPPPTAVAAPWASGGGNSNDTRGTGQRYGR